MAASEKHGGFRVLRGDADNLTLGISLPEVGLNTSQALHLFKASDAATNWNVSAYSDPTLVIHCADDNVATDYIKIWHDDTDANIDCYGTTALNLGLAGTNYAELTSTFLTINDIDFQLGDNDYLCFGDATGGDINIRWVGSYLHISQAAADSLIRWGADNAGIDQIWYGDTSGSLMRFDQSQDRLEFYGTDLQIGTDDYLQFGVQNDITIRWHTGNYLIVEQANVDSLVRWGVDGAGIDQMWYADTSGAYMLWDQSQDRLELLGCNLQLREDDQLQFGVSADINIRWHSGGYLLVSQAVADSLIRWGVDGAGIDQMWYGDTSGTYLLWDQSQDRLEFVAGACIDIGACTTAINISGTTTTAIQVGSDGLSGGGGDVYLYTPTASYRIFWDDDADTNKGTWYFGQDTYGMNVAMYGQTTGQSALWDASDARLEFNGADINLQDDDILQFGDSQDIAITWHSGGYLLVSQATTDSLIRWGVDNAGIDQLWYGDTSGSFMRWDQSADTLRFYGSDLQLRNDDYLHFGDQNDISIRWYNNYLVVTQANEGSTIRWGVDGAGMDIIWYGDTSGNYMMWDQSLDALKFSATAKLILPVKVSGSGVPGDIWLDTTDKKIHFADTDGTEQTVTS